MSKGVKILLWIVAVVAILAIVAFAAIKIYVTEERVRAWVIPPLEERLGRKVSFDSVSVGLTGFHLLGFDLRSAGAPAPLVAADGVEIAWRLMPLLSGTLEVDNVTLANPEIHIERLKDGTLDIDDLINKGASEPSTEKSDESRSSGQGGEKGIDVAVRRISVVDARASFTDRMPAKPVSYSVEELNLEVVELSNKAPFDFTLSAGFPTVGGAHLSAKGRIDPIGKAINTNINLSSLDLKSALGLVGESPVSAGTLSMNLDFSGRERRMGDLSGDIKVAGLILEEGGRRGVPTDISLSTKLSCPIDSHVITVEKLSMNAGGQALSCTGEFTHGDRPDFNLSIESPSISVDKLLAILPPAADENSKPGGSNGSGTAAPKAAAPSPIPVDGVVDLSIGELLASGFKVERVKATAALKNSKVTVTPLAAELYGGSFGGILSANLKEAGPPVNMDISMNGVQLSGLLGAVDGKLENSITGTLTGSVKGKAVGGDLEKLNVAFKTSSTEGKLYNHPAVLALASALKAPELEELNFYDLQMDGDASGGVANVTTGRLNGPDMRVELKGKAGLIDQKISFDLVAAVPEKIAKRLIGDRRVREALSDSQGWTKVPFKVRGSTSSPKLTLDESALGKSAGKVLEKEVEKKIQKAVGDKFDAGGLLKGLLGK